MLFLTIFVLALFLDVTLTTMPLRCSGLNSFWPFCHVSIKRRVVFAHIGAFFVDGLSNGPANYRHRGARGGTGARRSWPRTARIESLRAIISSTCCSEC